MSSPPPAFWFFPPRRSRSRRNSRPSLPICTMRFGVAGVPKYAEGSATGPPEPRSWSLRSSWAAFAGLKKFARESRRRRRAVPRTRTVAAGVAARSVRSGHTIAGAQEDAAGAVRNQPTAGLPDTGPAAGGTDLVGPHADRSGCRCSRRPPSRRSGRGRTSSQTPCTLPSISSSPGPLISRRAAGTVAGSLERGVSHISTGQPASGSGS